VITTLQQQAEELLLHQFKESERLKGLVRALATPFEELRVELEKLHRGHYIDNATGETLDVIGSIVGQPRNGMSDGDYQPWIKVAVHLNNSAGTAESIFAIIKILYRMNNGVIALTERTPNIVKLTLNHPFFPEESIKAIIMRAVPVTTKCKVMFDLSPSVTTMRLDATAAVALNSDAVVKRLSYFQFDYTAFDKSYFLDFS